MHSVNFTFIYILCSIPCLFGFNCYYGTQTISSNGTVSSSLKSRACQSLFSCLSYTVQDNSTGSTLYFASCEETCRTCDGMNILMSKAFKVSKNNFINCQINCCKTDLCNTLRTNDTATSTLSVLTKPLTTTTKSTTTNAAPTTTTNKPAPATTIPNPAKTTTTTNPAKTTTTTNPSPTTATSATSTPKTGSSTSTPDSKSRNTTTSKTGTGGSAESTWNSHSMIISLFISTFTLLIYGLN